jgi:hyperosmotically inducible periplasmic protein
MVTAMVLGIGLALPSLAEDTSAPVPASNSMSQAGSDTAGAAKNAYHGTVTALDDTKITTMVKAGLVSGKEIDSNHIHVTTVAGVVTLSGQTANSDMSARAESIAKNTSGVRGVNNNLLVSPSAQN